MDDDKEELEEEDEDKEADDAVNEGEIEGDVVSTLDTLIAAICSCSPFTVI